MIRRLAVALINTAARATDRVICAFPNLTNTDPDQEDPC